MYDKTAVFSNAWMGRENMDNNTAVIAWMGRENMDDNTAVIA